MMPHHILEKVLELKVFQMWELVEELSKDWDFILTRKRIKDRVRTWIKNNTETGFVKVVSKKPLIFAVKEYAKDWREHVRLRTCPVCGKEFLPLKSQTLYCSQACANKRYAKKKWEKVKPEKRRAKRWTQEELELIRELTKEKGRLTAQDLRDLASLLGRTYKAVMHKYYEEVRR